MPVLDGGRLFVNSTNRAVMFKLNGAALDAVKPQFESQRMTCQIGNTILDSGLLLGPIRTSAAASLTALDAKTGERKWNHRVTGVGFLYQYKDGFMAIRETGEISFNRIQNRKLETVAPTIG